MPHSESDDAWLRRSQLALRVAGVAYALFAVVASVAIPLVEAPPERRALGFVSTALCLGVPTLLIGAANFVCASALGQGKKWAFMVSAVLAFQYTLSCIALPIGVVILYTFLRPGAWNTYMREAR